jgi:6-phosphogluconolactonase
MKIEVFADPQSVARRAAAIIADEAWDAIAARGRFVMAVSGGHTPWLMLHALGETTIPWRAVYILQVDERVAPPGHPDRNLTHIRECLSPHVSPEQIYAMPVDSPDLEAAAGEYTQTVWELTGSPLTLDLVHLGLGPDGHTASLVPGDPVLDVGNAEVALTGPYRGRRRMTLTYPAINRARRVLWVVTGDEKAGMVNRLLLGDRSIPAGRVCRDRALLLADCPAAAAYREATEGVAACE